MAEIRRAPDTTEPGGAPHDGVERLTRALAALVDRVQETVSRDAPAP